MLGPGALGGHFVDFGAEVIKVEAPGGDYVRQMTWPIVHDEHGSNSLMHLHLNRGKKSVVLDLKTEDGRERLRRRSSDVRRRRDRGDAARLPRQDRLRLRAAEASCNRASSCARSPGTAPPARTANLPSHGIAYDAWSGVGQARRRRRRVLPHPDAGQRRHHGRTGVRGDGDPRRPRARPHHRRAGLMEIAQSDASRVLRLVPHRVASAPTSDLHDEVTGNASDGGERRPAGLAGMWEGVRYQFYESADGHVLFMASEQVFWKNFCAGVGRPDLFERWPGAKYADHARGNIELQAELRDIFRTRTTAEWLDVRRRAQHDHRPRQHGGDAARRSAVPATASRGSGATGSVAINCSCRSASRRGAAGAGAGAGRRPAHRRGARLAVLNRFLTWCQV